MKLSSIGVFISSAVLLSGQVPVVRSVLNNATNDTHLCPGVVARVSGDFGHKATVTVGGRQAFIFHSTSTGLLIQIPAELTPGTASLIVASGGATSKPLPLTLDAEAPGLVTTDSSGTGAGFFRHATGGPVKPTRPASRGESIIVSATGLGPTNPKVATGDIPSSDAPTVLTPVVMVGNRAARVSFSGISGTRDISLIGTYRITFTVPSDAPLGANRFSISIGGHTSNVVTLDVR